MKNILKPILLFLFVLAISSCTKELEDKSAIDILRKEQVFGVYIGSISPRMMDIVPITSGIHEMYLEELPNGKLRLHFEKFREAPMPFMMIYDITMDVKRGPGGEGGDVLFNGKDGHFTAALPFDKPIDPADAPPGIKLPEGGENGMFSNRSTIEGKYGIIEIDGKKQKGIEFRMIPGLPLPVVIRITNIVKIDSKFEQLLKIHGGSKDYTIESGSDESSIVQNTPTGNSRISFFCEKDQKMTFYYSEETNKIEEWFVFSADKVEDNGVTAKLSCDSEQEASIYNVSSIEQKEKSKTPVKIEIEYNRETKILNALFVMKDGYIIKISAKNMNENMTPVHKNTNGLDQAM